MGDAYEKLLSNFDKINATMEEMEALMRNQLGHCQQGGSPISITKKYPYLFQNHRSTATPTQNQNITRVSKIDFSKLSGSKVDTGKHKNEGKQLDLSLLTVAPTTVPIEPSLPTDSSPLSFNQLMSCDDGPETSLVVDVDIADPVESFDVASFESHLPFANPRESFNEIQDESPDEDTPEAATAAAEEDGLGEIHNTMTLNYKELIPLVPLNHDPVPEIIDKSIDRVPSPIPVQIHPIDKALSNSVIPTERESYFYLPPKPPDRVAVAK